MKTALKLGLLCGLTMGTRVGGLILIGYLWIFAAAFFAYLRQYPRRPVAGKLVLITVMAYAIMLAFWPYALGKPFIRPFTTLKWLSYVQPASSPRSYLPNYFLVKLPELVILLAAIACFLGLRALFTKPVSKNLPQMFSYALLVFSVLCPVLYAVITRPFLYDEVRHFLFIMPPLYCLAGVALNEVLKRALQKPLLAGALLLCFGVYLTLHIRIMAGLHPYEYAYFNRFAGGVKGAHDKGYDPEYWATSYKEGVARLTTYLRDRDGAQFDNKQYSILLGSAGWCAIDYFPRNFHSVTEPSEADFYLSITETKPMRSMTAPRCSPSAALARRSWSQKVCGSSSSEL